MLDPPDVVVAVASEAPEWTAWAAWVRGKYLLV